MNNISPTLIIEIFKNCHDKIHKKHDFIASHSIRTSISVVSITQGVGSPIRKALESAVKEGVI